MDSPAGGNIIVQKEMKFSKPIVIGGFMNQTPLGVLVTSYIVERLNMHQVAVVKSKYIPPVTVFVGRRMRSPFRVYSNADGTLLVVQSEVPVRSDGLSFLSETLMTWLKSVGIKEFAVIDGVPIRDIGPRTAYLVGSADRIKELSSYKIEVAESAIISGMGGAIINECIMTDINAIALISPHAIDIPDPDSVLAIVKGLNSIYKLNIDTGILEESVNRLHEQLNKISEEYKAAKTEDTDNSMYK